MWLSRDLLPAPYYCLCLNEKQFKKALKRLSVPKDTWPSFVMRSSDATVHFFTKNGVAEISCIVCLNPGDREIEIEQIHALLVHEAVHIWQELRKVLGDTGIETEAYSIQSISQNLFYAFKQLNSK